MEYQDTTHQRRTLFRGITGLAFLSTIIALLVLLWRKLRAKRIPVDRGPIKPPLPVYADIQGLTEEEATARQIAGQDNAIYVKPLRSHPEIWKYNTLSIFNLSLVGLAFVQLLLGQPLDALMSLGVMVLNIAVNVVQELVAQRRLRDFVSAAQPKVTVIREGKARNIDANNVVLGDMLVIGPGDQILVDGQLVGEGQVVVDESLLTGESARPTRGAGDQVFAGSYCVSGRAVCESQNVGDQRLVASLVADTQNSKDSLTPIEHIINRILRGLLVIVIIFSVLLIIRYFQMDVGLPIDDFINATNIIFSIAPAGLFFMILLTYTAGTADMAKIGALVHRARSVESLAQVNVICFARAGEINVQS
jgi:cation-transporting ATPase E